MQQREPWQMTDPERADEIASLRKEHARALAEPGGFDLGPDDIRRISKRRHKKGCALLQERFHVERRIERLSRSTETLTEQHNSHLAEQKAIEVGQLRSMAQTLRDLASRGMRPRAHVRQAEKLEKQAEVLLAE